MKLFCYALAPYSKKVLFVAHERGVEVEKEDVPPFDREAVAAMRRNECAIATVPLLRLDDGSHLTESSSIAEYFDRIGTVGHRLVPPDEGRAFEVRDLDRLADSLFAPVVYLTWALKKSEDKRNLPRTQEMREKLELVATEIETRLARRGTSFLSGETPSLADASVSAALHTAVYDRTLADLERWPTIARWYERVVARDSWKYIEVEASKLPGPP